MTLDLMHLLGFKGEIDRARADLWGRVYLEAVKNRTGTRASYATAEAQPSRVPASLGGM
jgi:hypothetical protein